MKKITLVFIGKDSWGRPVYEGDGDRLFKDTSLGDGAVYLCTVSGGFDGEPDTPVEHISTYKDAKFELVQPEEPTAEEKFNYQMLSRLQMDCEYYLGYGNRNPRRLWGTSVKEHLEEMKKIFNEFSEEKKPEWLSWDDILTYEKNMLQGEE